MYLLIVFIIIVARVLVHYRWSLTWRKSFFAFWFCICSVIILVVEKLHFYVLNYVTLCGMCVGLQIATNEVDEIQTFKKLRKVDITVYFEASP